MKGMSFSNKRYTKGVPFLKKWYIKGLGVGPRGGASPYKTFLSTPPGTNVACKYMFTFSTVFLLIKTTIKNVHWLKIFKRI